MALTVDIPHKLGAAEAKRRIENGAGSFARFLPAGAKVEQSWAGDRLDMGVEAMGQQVRAGISIGEQVVRVALELPPALAFFGQAIEQGIRTAGTELLQDKSKR